MRIILHSIMAILITSISGCGSVSFNDVSDIKPYSEVVGLIITSQKELILHGWTEEDSTVKKPVFYSFSSPPGVANRFVKSRNTIQSGLKLKIIAVEKCNDCYLDLNPRIKFRVSLQNLKTDYDLPVYLDDSYLIKDWGNSNKAINYNMGSFTIGS